MAHACSTPIRSSRLRSAFSVTSGDVAKGCLHFHPPHALAVLVHERLRTGLPDEPEHAGPHVQGDTLGLLLEGAEHRLLFVGEEDLLAHRIVTSLVSLATERRS